MHNALQNLSDRGSLPWILNHSQDEVILQRAKGDIKFALDVFSVCIKRPFGSDLTVDSCRPFHPQLQCSVGIEQDIRRQQHSVQQQQEQVLDLITEIRQATLADITRENHGVSLFGILTVIIHLHVLFLTEGRRELADVVRMPP